MNNVLLTMFFVDLIALFYLVYKYFNALKSCINRAATLGKLNELRALSVNPTPLGLMSDVKFYVSLFTGSYREDISDQLIVKDLNLARRYLIIQYPLGLVAFILPIVSRVLM